MSTNPSLLERIQLEPDDVQALVGLPLSSAEVRADESGAELRIVDGEGAPDIIHHDFRPNRINIEVRDQHIIRIDSIG